MSSSPLSDTPTGDPPAGSPFRPRPPPRKLCGVVNPRDVLEWILPNAESCREEAAKLRLENPDLPPVEVARLAVRNSRRWAAGMGAVTGVVANPITLLPAALADAAAMLKIEGNLAGVVAALLDPASLDDPDAFRRDVMRVVFPGAVSQVLRKLGVRAGERAAKDVMAKYVTRGALKEVAEHAAKRLGVQVTEKAIATKAVPLVGAGIGAAWNWVEIQAIGLRAIDYHTGGEGTAPIKAQVRAWARQGADRIKQGANSIRKVGRRD